MQQSLKHARPCKCNILLLILSAFFLTACGPQFIGPDTVRTEPVLEAEIFVSFDGARLPLRSWLPQGQPEAILVAIHGFNDYSHFINDAALFFTRHAVAVYAYDQRGFGASPNRGRWPGKDALGQDVQAFVALLRARYPTTPLLLLGESMGAAVVLHALVRSEMPQAMDVDGVILSAPAVWGWNSMPFWQRWSLKLAAHSMPWITLTGQGLRISASDNQAMLRAFSSDPLVIKAARVDTLYGLVDLMQSAHQSVASLRHPALILYGDNDEVIPKAPVLGTFGPLTQAHQHQRLQVYKHGYHMLLRDLQAEVLWRDIMAWIRHKPVLLPSEQAGLSYQPDVLRNNN